ncbi:hypothetical protein EVAR_103520_1 [Eumeta japonica]|uniref:HTH psq-type domain-containing protein n=1 Tax=Eumeta variegata TaxID=151549 RepID=A0A4C1YXM4_EUMVA|nr:hypothetical protein EVAR_103520_1 [Eumeta japonica]
MYATHMGNGCTTYKMHWSGASDTVARQPSHCEARLNKEVKFERKRCPSLVHRHSARSPFAPKRVRVKKSNPRGQNDLSTYKDAHEEVKPEVSLRKAADKHGINHCSLLRYLRKRHASSHYNQRTYPEKSGLNAAVVNSGLTKMGRRDRAAAARAGAEVHRPSASGVREPKVPYQL